MPRRRSSEGHKGPPPAKSRASLNRDAVLTAAVQLADTDGLEAVSMRRLAESLGVVPMALYRHISDKEDLVDGMVDQIIAEFETTSPDDATDWISAVRAAIMSARYIVRRHDWARRAIETRTTRSPAVLGHLEYITRLLLNGGLSADLTHHAMHALGNRVWGFSPELFNAPAGTPARERTGPQPNPEDFPAILAVAAAATALRPNTQGCDEDFEFDFALALLLDGIARLHTAEWSSSGGEN